MLKVTLDKLLGIRYPVIVAPMFLISNTSMIKAALKSGVTAAFPALNYRTDRELREAIADIRSETDLPFGVNLIVNRSNYKYKSQLRTLQELRPAFIITSLGNPKEVIETCRPLGIKVFCDVIDLAHAKKVEESGADALIAVNAMAGGHAGHTEPRKLMEELLNGTSLPVISAGGIGKGDQLAEVMSWGACGASIGTIFIASDESPVSREYKNAIVEYGAKDIVRTTKLSGSPLTVINTPYVQKMGTQATWLEKLMHQNKWLKKYIKLYIALRGIKKIERSTFGFSYQTLWCAGPAIEYVSRVRPMAEILHDLIEEYENAKK